MEQPIIELKDVTMKYRLSREKVDNIKEYILKRLKGKLAYNEFQALRNISLRVNKGENLGVIGLNGAGKSTLLKIIAGVLKPSIGEITINGSMAPLIELGAGFDENLTGKENIFLNGSILGYNRSYLRDKMAEIIEFSELNEFIDVPIKNYSSGMKARLGFSIATVTNPDILIVDEALAVGDHKFQQKCHKRMETLIDHGTTILFVSHSLSEIQRMCSKTIWLEKGILKMSGATDEVLAEFRKNE